MAGYRNNRNHTTPAFMPAAKAEKIAKIMGVSSAAAQALAEMRRRQATGEDVILYSIGNTIIVGPRPVADQ